MNFSINFRFRHLDFTKEFQIRMKYYINIKKIAYFNVKVKLIVYALYILPILFDQLQITGSLRFN